MKSEGIQDFLAFSGYSLLEMINRNPIGAYFITLKPWDQRTSKDLQASSIMRRLNKEFYKLPEGQIMAFNPPAIQGLGTVGGFEFWVVNEGNASLDDLEKATNDIIKKSKQTPELTGLSTAIEADCMELYINLDTAKTRALQVEIDDVYSTLQVLLGSLYVNNFNKYGQVFQVVAQAEPQYRSSISDIGDVYVRAKTGDMVPLKALVTTRYDKGPTLISRFNTFPAAKITGSPAPGYSSGQAMKAMQELADETLPDGMTIAWSGEAYQEQSTGGASFGALAAGLVMVFLVLAALYETMDSTICYLDGCSFWYFRSFRSCLDTTYEQ